MLDVAGRDRGRSVAHRLLQGSAGDGERAPEAPVLGVGLGHQLESRLEENVLEPGVDLGVNDPGGEQHAEAAYGVGQPRDRELEREELTDRQISSGVLMDRLDRDDGDGVERGALAQDAHDLVEEGGGDLGGAGPVVGVLDDEDGDEPRPSQDVQRLLKRLERRLIGGGVLQLLGRLQLEVRTELGTEHRALGPAPEAEAEAAPRALRAFGRQGAIDRASVASRQRVEAPLAETFQRMAAESADRSDRVGRRRYGDPERHVLGGKVLGDAADEAALPRARDAEDADHALVGGDGAPQRAVSVLGAQVGEADMLDGEELEAPAGVERLRGIQLLQDGQVWNSGASS